MPTIYRNFLSNNRVGEKFIDFDAYLDKYYRPTPFLHPYFQLEGKQFSFFCFFSIEELDIYAHIESNRQLINDLKILSIGEFNYDGNFYIGIGTENQDKIFVFTTDDNAKQQLVEISTDVFTFVNQLQFKYDEKIELSKLSKKYLDKYYLHDEVSFFNLTEKAKKRIESNKISIKNLSLIQFNNSDNYQVFCTDYVLDNLRSKQVSYMETYDELPAFMKEIAKIQFSQIVENTYAHLSCNPLQYPFLLEDIRFVIGQYCISFIYVFLEDKITVFDIFDVEDLEC